MVVENRFNSNENADSLFRQPTSADLPALRELIAWGERHGSVLPRPDLKEVYRNFLIFAGTNAKKIDVCASLDPYELPDIGKGIPGLAELRTVVSRIPGAAPYIVYLTLQRAKSLNIGDVFTTTDKPEVFERYGFGMKKGGNEILWMDLKKEERIIFRRTPGEFHVEAALPEHADRIMGLMNQGEEVLPMDRRELEHRLGSFFVCLNREKQVVGSVGAVIYPALTGKGIPRMAEIRDLTVDTDYQDQGIELMLLQSCRKRFVSQHVKQAFITVTSERKDTLTGSRLFLDKWGGKTVLWWDGN